MKIALDKDEMETIMAGGYGETGGGRGGGFWTSCAGATILLGIAAGGLATIEVGTFGAATGFAVAGWLGGSAAWGAACGGKGK